MVPETSTDATATILTWVGSASAGSFFVITVGDFVLNSIGIVIGNYFPEDSGAMKAYKTADQVWDNFRATVDKISMWSKGPRNDDK